MKSTVRARANIALIKYWGKADSVRNIPAVGSISVTLDDLWSETTVEFDADLPDDTLVLDGSVRPEQLARVSGCLDLLREQAGVATRARVVSNNNFPTGAGLASSASGFAALTAAAARALKIDLLPKDLTMIARVGSGSAARSIFGGYVEMHAGTMADGSDSFAAPLLAADAWPLEIVIAITAKGEKATGSRAGMSRSASTSPYYDAWVATSNADLDVGRDAVLGQDFKTLAAVAEHSCLKMHALAMANRPPLLYWNPATIACIQAVRSMQANGLPVFFTIDAGPQLKAICGPGAGAAISQALAAVPGVLETIVTKPGPGIESV